MFRTLAAGAVALLLIGAAPVVAPGTEADRDPDWLVKPDGDMVARFYPDRAERLNMEGRVTLLCTVGLDTRLHDCSVVSEDPVGYGFAAASLRLAREMRMAPAIRSGLPSRSLVRVPLRFSQPSESLGRRLLTALMLVGVSVLGLIGGFVRYSRRYGFWPSNAS